MSCQKKHVRFVQDRKKVAIHPNLNTFVGLPVDSFFLASKTCQANSYITGLIRNQFLYPLTGISASPLSFHQQLLYCSKLATN